MTTIWARVALEGFHHWPGAPDHYAHLRHEHRHLFELRAEVPVNHGDREVAFEDLRVLLVDAWPGPELGQSSCEQIAEYISGVIANQLERPVAVSVSEDGEAGATVERAPV